MILSSSVRDLIELCCDFGRLCLIFVLSFGVRGISVTFVKKASKSLSLPLGGIQLVLFLTSDWSFSSSFPSKYSTSLTFRVNSILSSFNFCIFGLVGVGVNLRPLSKSLVSFCVSFLEDRFTICISVLHAIFCCMVHCHGTKKHLSLNLCFLVHFYPYSGDNYFSVCLIDLVLDHQDCIPVDLVVYYSNMDNFD